MSENFQIQTFDEVTSTNDLAFKLLAENSAQHHTIILANSQTNGRGRQDRSWISPRGNLYFSLILQSENFSKVTDFSFLSACVIGDVLRLYGIQTKYKWPNDIMLDEKKLAGILLQFQKINRAPTLVIGVGLNLVSAPDYAASLATHKITREDFLQKFTEIFSAYESDYACFGFASIRERWKKNAYKIGEKIKLSSGASGVFSDVDTKGNLLLLEDGVEMKKVAIDEIL
jgi:BirA family biotin operon repressor/biotin-[acetyl-CoA-carboxylase] ligase